MPIATTGPAETAPPQLHGGGRPGRAEPRREFRDRGIVQGADDVVSGRQAAPGNAVRHHPGVAEHGRPGPQRRLGRQDGASGEANVGRSLDQPAGVDDAHRHRFFGCVERPEVGLGSDHREALGIDGGAVADVVVGHLGRPSQKAAMRFGTASGSSPAGPGLPSEDEAVATVFGHEGQGRGGGVGTTFGTARDMQHDAVFDMAEPEQGRPAGRMVEHRRRAAVASPAPRDRQRPAAADHPGR